MTLPTTFEITLEFLSDWHIGTGQGRLGTIDAEVRRDADGLPFVPAKTLIGVWRDACETVAETFDRAAHRPGAWLAWVTWLFGSQSALDEDPTAQAGRQPVPAALRLTPAQGPLWLRAAVRHRPALAQAAVTLRPGVSIDDQSGTAADGLLRVEERAIRGLRLYAQASLASTSGAAELPEPAELLLRAGARLMEAIGGKRNRGSGRVAVLLPGSSVDITAVHQTVTDPTLTALLAAGVPGTPPRPPAAPEAVEIYPYGQRHVAQRRTVRVVFQVITPVVTGHAVMRNVILSRDVIPGTALLSTILANVEAADSDGGGRIGLGDLSVGDAVPAIIDPRNPGSVIPARPVPAAWHRGDKGRGTIVRNAPTAEQVRDERAKPMSGWIVQVGDGWQSVEPAMAVSTHAVVDDAARRPTVASGGVFTYQGIAPNTLLCSDIVLPAEVRLRLRIGERLRFGRSRKDDFGLVEVVTVVDPLPAAAPPAPAADPQTLRVWCVSDVLLRDDRLALDPSPRALARALSVALEPASFEVDSAGTVSGAIRREGFGVASGRPRPSQVALRAGSVVSLTVTGSVDAAELAELERDGIGGRTAEGYGRILFNPPELTTAQPAVDFVDEDNPSSPRFRSDDGSSILDPSDPNQALSPQEPVHPLEINAWRRAIRQASADLRPEKLVKGINRMAGNRAQLGALRVQLERLALPSGPDLVRDWLAGTRAVRARREMWTPDVLKELTALLLDDESRIWCSLGLAGKQPTLVLGPGREEAVRQRLHTEALTIAITDALRRLSRADGKAIRGAQPDGDHVCAGSGKPVLDAQTAKEEW